MERNFIDGYTEWQSNPEIVGVNKLPQHATFMPYENFDEAKKADRFASSRMKLLNGKWKFKLYKNYAYRPSSECGPGRPAPSRRSWPCACGPCCGPCRWGPSGRP